MAEATDSENAILVLLTNSDALELVATNCITGGSVRKFVVVADQCVLSEFVAKTR